MKLQGGNTEITDIEKLGQVLKAKISDSEDKLDKIQKLMQCIEKGELSEDLLEVCPSLAKLRQENERLKYRRQILKQSIEEEKARPAKEVENTTGMERDECSDSIMGTLKSVFYQAIKAAFPDLANAPVVLAEAGKKPQFGDYQCNSAMAISKQLSSIGQKLNPRQVAEKILGAVPPSDLINKLEIAGPGFINIHLNQNEIAQKVSDLLTQGVKPPKLRSRRVVIDYSSPNIAKEMHVGHLRSTIIGESVSRLLEYLGFDVLRLNHVGDWGTQFGMLIAHLEDKFPNFRTETPPLSDLQAFYKESKQRFDSDEAFKARAYECVVKLQTFDPEFVKAWQMICDVSRKDFERIYKRLDVSIVERGESFYQERMKEVVKELSDIGVLQEEDGRQLMFVNGRDVPLTVVKSDGGFTYDTSDLAALKQRATDEKAEWILYVVDVGQGLHLETIYAAGKQLGWISDRKHRVEHVGFGLVLGEDKKKFKTRSGDTVRLTDLLDEGLKRALAKLVEKEREKVLNPEELKAAEEAVAYGCIKYADLSNNRTSDYVFSFDRMLDDKGNTAVYLLYAYTRIRSIKRTANIEREKVLEEAQKGPLILTEPSEFKLAKTILKFPDVLMLVLETLRLHFLCDFMYEMATVFSEFYSECYCIEKDKETGTIKKIHMNRLALSEATADVMAACFSILGIQTVEKM